VKAQRKAFLDVMMAPQPPSPEQASVPACKRVCAAAGGDTKAVTANAKIKLVTTQPDRIMMFSAFRLVIRNLLILQLNRPRGELGTEETDIFQMPAQIYRLDLMTDVISKYFHYLPPSKLPGSCGG
jgi:hypothetical protein